MNNFRTIDGSGNNPDNLGEAGSNLRRILSPAFSQEDLPRGIIESEPGNLFIGSSSLPNPREISNTVSAQDESVLNNLDTSDWIWQWGQFLDHDLDLNEGGDEPFFIPINPEDPLLANNLGDASVISVPTSNGGEQLLIVETDEDFTLPIFNDTPSETVSLEELMTSEEFVVTDEFIEDLEEELDTELFSSNSQSSPDEISFIPFTRIPDADPETPSRQYTNDITSFIDGSQVYGSESESAESLRANDGTGKLRSEIINGEELLPTDAEGNFVAGDVRVNEQVGLTAAHTLFLREHNRLAEDIGNRIDRGDEQILQLFEESGLERGDFIYESARKVVGAEIQFITYNEYLPLLLGDSLLEDYGGYDAEVDPTIALEFANVSFRLGHSQLSDEIQRINLDGTSAGGVSLREAFFSPQIVRDDGANSVLLGLPTQIAQEVDNLVVDGVRNFLFPAETGGFDLAAVNIQRGRDVGLPSYNDARRELGLAPATAFLTANGEQGITSDPETAERFASVYDSVEDVDFWLGGIAEDPVNGGLVGELFSSVLTEQFSNLRDGDRFFYLNDGSDLAVLAPDLADTTLSSVIQINTESEAVIQANAFVVPGLSVDVATENSEGNIDFIVSLSDVSGAIVTVDFTTVDVSGIAGEDYVSQGGTLTFNPGEQSQVVSIPLLNDGVLQEDEIFQLRLSNPSNQNLDRDTAETQPVISREIEGTANSDSLEGGQGNDTIIARSGNDTLTGNGGNDLLQGNQGADVLDGGSGNDTLDGGDGNDILSSLAGDNSLIAGNGNDTLDSGDGADILDGGSGDDILNSLAGDDSLIGGNGNDTLDSGEGNDTLLGDNGSDILRAGGGDDSLTGGDNNDNLDGGSGNDTLLGDNGDDLLVGGSGDDLLMGGRSNDVLDGGLGTDILDGGNGDDLFVLRVGDGSSQILDFNLAGDRLGLADGLQFSDLGFAGNNILAGEEILASLDGINTEQLTSNDFRTF